MLSDVAVALVAMLVGEAVLWPFRHRVLAWGRRRRLARGIPAAVRLSAGRGWGRWRHGHVCSGVSDGAWRWRPGYLRPGPIVTLETHGVGTGVPLHSRGWNLPFMIVWTTASSHGLLQIGAEAEFADQIADLLGRPADDADGPVR